MDSRPICMARGGRREKARIEGSSTARRVSSGGVGGPRRGKLPYFPSAERSTLGPGTAIPGIGGATPDRPGEQHGSCGHPESSDRSVRVTKQRRSARASSAGHFAFALVRGIVPHRAAGQAAPTPVKIVVFPFELDDLTPASALLGASTSSHASLERVTAAARESLKASGRYSVIDESATAAAATPAGEAGASATAARPPRPPGSVRTSRCWGSCGAQLRPITT